MCISRLNDEWHVRESTKSDERKTKQNKSSAKRDAECRMSVILKLNEKSLAYKSQIYTRGRYHTNGASFKRTLWPKQLNTYLRPKCRYNNGTAHRDEIDGSRSMQGPKLTKKKTHEKTPWPFFRRRRRRLLPATAAAASEAYTKMREIILQPNIISHIHTDTNTNFRNIFLLLSCARRCSLIWTRQLKIVDGLLQHQHSGTK